MMLKIVTALRAAREIEGYGQDNGVARVKSRADLSGLSTPLAPDAAVVELHARPRLLVPGAAAAAGVLLLGMLVVLRSKRRGASDLASATAAEDVQAVAASTAQHAPTGPPLRVMLLNLSRDAGADAIENAPPLGTRDDVISALMNAVEDARFDRSRNAALEHPDVQVTIDVGTTDPVYTAVISARGAALPVLRRILDQTGWRAFDAKSGAFISADTLESADVTPLAARVV